MSISKSHYRSALIASCLFSIWNGAVASASTGVLVYSGTFDGDHPAPVMVGKVKRGDRFEIEVGRASALVNYPDPYQPIITERINTFESGAIVTCPWFMTLEQKGLGTRIDKPHRAEISHKVFCDSGGCTKEVGQPIAQADLLFGKYNLPKVKSNSGQDLGFLDMQWDETPVTDCPEWAVCCPKLNAYWIYCPEFTIERTYSEQHFFEKLLNIENYREQNLTDLDVDFRKVYLTFENEKQDRANCVITDLLGGGDVLRIDDLKDCVLPAGDQFTMYVQSRFFLKDTRPCGKFVTKGVKTPDGYVPDWFMGWYECDGQADRTPIEKQYTYATRVELQFTKLNIGGN